MRQTTFAVLSLLLAAVALTGCGGDMVLLNPAGPVSKGLSYLMMLSIYVMLCVVIPTIIMSLVFAWKYRKNNKDANYQPNWAHSTLIEVVVWGIPITIIFCLAIVAFKGSHEYDPYKSRATGSEKELTIQVIAEQFKWIFIYPEQQIATINEVRFPVKQPVGFRITSNFTMGSFFIPKLAGQIYAMAGMQTQLHMIANEVTNETNSYRGFSANITGYGNGIMRFRALSLTQADFDTWVQTIKDGRGATVTVDDGMGHPTKAIQKGMLDEAEFAKLRDGARSEHQIKALFAEAERTGNAKLLAVAKEEERLGPFPTKPAPVTYYSSVDVNLFQKVIDKYASNPDNKRALMPLATSQQAPQHTATGE